MFEDIQVYAQPAAVIDGIVQVWILKDLGKEFPASIWQRDIVGAAMTVEAKEAMSLIGQIPAFIAGKMTPVLQVTDTDFAFRLKVFIRQEMDVLRDALRQKAKLQGLPCVFKCGPFEVLWCLSKALQQLKAVTIEENLVLKACRRYGLLGYRPDMEGQRLVRS